MYLSKLELHGFKSFASPTTVDFSPGITAIVGPNGCGKSNVVDAVRWVIGEQRARILRSDKMENVIFNGTSKKRPLGLAEVNLTIENTRGVLPVQYSEITIGRRLFRSGESEYLLNGSQCRLKDISDLFMDTGMGAGAYSVIELHMIEEILSDNAQDRRHLFEEAAGITKYKLRRSQTMRRLDATQADITRLRDLIDEIEKRVRSLRRQASKATRYKELADRLRELDLLSAALDLARFESERLTLQQAIKGIQSAMEGSTADRSRREADVEALKTRMVEDETRLSERQQRLAAYLEKIRSLDSDQRVNEEKLKAATREVEGIAGERTNAEARVAELRERIEQISAEVTALTPELQGHQAQLAEAESHRARAEEQATAARGELDNTVEAEQRAVQDLTEALREHDRLVQRTDLLEQDRTLTTDQLKDVRGTVESLGSRESELLVQRDEAARQAADARQELQRKEQQREMLLEALNLARERRHNVEREMHGLRAEMQLLESLVSSYDDVAEPVQFLASDRGWSSNDFVTVADIFSCDEKYRPAVEAALGEYASTIIVANDDEAAAAMAYLRKHGKGMATFLVRSRLSAMRTHDGPSSASGIPLRSFVTVARGYDHVADALLSPWVLVDRLDETTSPVNGHRFVTADGQWVAGTGLMHGGGTNESASNSRISRRAQLDRASRALAALIPHIEDAVAAVDQAERELDDVPVDAGRASFEDRERALAEAERQLSRVQLERESVKRRADDLESRLERLATAIDETVTESTRATAKVSEVRGKVGERRDARAEKESAFRTAEAASHAALAHYNETNVNALRLQSKIDGLIAEKKLGRDELESIRLRLENYDIRSTELAAVIQGAQTNLATIADNRELLIADGPVIEAEVESAREKLHETRTAISDLEAAIRDLRRSREEQMREENQRAVKLAEVQTRMENLAEHLQEEYQIAFEDLPDASSADLGDKQVKEEVKDLRNRIRSIGPINELALEEYEQEKERLDFMQGQFTDLLEAEKTLKETIDEINETASQRFNEAFYAIRENFRSLFERLFGEDAKADLRLDNADDPLESPIEVFARPKGKRPSILNQLSGGEKTLTAIALLFSIYLVKPSPFCILDEVDAPLDDANVGRFMNLIREFADTTQFILVTHNKRTMEAADRMYGITMQEQGVSKLVGVRFDEEVAA